jgi:hypothetical protein
VQLDPAGPTYSEGTTVTLTPVPDSGYVFDSWTGTNAGDLSDNGNGTWSVTMGADKAVIANFEVDPNPPVNVSVRVNQGSDDAEELVSTGAMDLTSTDLDAIQILP